MHTTISDSEDEYLGSSMDAILLGKTWEAIGPFPSGMREHPMTASPLSTFLFDDTLDADVDFAIRPYNPDESFPSELGFGGKVYWDKFERGQDGWVEVSYSNVRWDQHRMDRGWAALQYQTLLRTNIHIPQLLHDGTTTPLLVDLIQGTEFALIPTTRAPQLPIKWYQGDVYDFANTSTGSSRRPLIREQTSNFARSISIPPGDYVLLVRAMYEIRMFGDPGQGKAPVIKMKLAVELDRICNEMEDESSSSLGHKAGQGMIEIMDGLSVVPDLVGGRFMGDWFSIGIRVPSGDNGPVIVNSIDANIDLDIRFTLPSPVVIFPGQMRPLALAVQQKQPLPDSVAEISISIHYTRETKRGMSIWKIPMSRKDLGKPFKMTFASPSSPSSGSPALVSYATVIPPSDFDLDIGHMANKVNLPPVILALHGAGVDAASPFWIDAIPTRPGGWAVLPTEKNEWGEDYHGGSMGDCWAARDVIGEVVEKLGYSISTDTILMGHSNGGQGAWHLAARYPDRIIGCKFSSLMTSLKVVIVASGWLKIQDYVPYTSSVSTHYADPALMGILHSSLTPYNNDLHASNLAHVPILVIHGSEDDNVPPVHSRSHVSLISSWQGTQMPNNVKLIEVPKESHWWDDVFRVEGVEEFMNGLKKVDREVMRKKGFTLTCGNPGEGGGKAGIRIVELEIPGRLARLDVNARQWRRGAEDSLQLHGMNVKRLAIDGYDHYTQAEINNRTHPLIDRETKVVDLKTTSESPKHGVRAYGPMIRLLATSGPMVFIIPPNDSVFTSLATRLAHDLYLYHRVDSEIVMEQEALERTAHGILGRGNVVSLGRPEENKYTAWMIAQKRIPLTFPTKSVMMIDDKLIYEGGTGLITLHPHPVFSQGLAAIIAGNDAEGLELAARLFPLRTGVPIPDWAVVGSRSKWQGANGFIGAGFWNGNWGWNDAMSWMDR